jgi:predicted methyltransferase
MTSILRWSRVVAVSALLAAPCRAQVRGGDDIFARRDEWQRVSDIVASLRDVKGKRIADIAAGKGYLTKHLARAVGVSGRVYAVEVGEEELRALTELSQTAAFNCVEAVRGSETDSHLPDNIDGAVILDSYHELTNYQAMLASIFRSLRPGAALVIVDNAPFHMWRSESRSFQASHHAIDPTLVASELRAAGFEIARRDDAFITRPVEQWLIVARRP